MRTGYTYDDEMLSSQGSYVNNGCSSLRAFTGRKMGHIKIDPTTRQMVIVRLTEQEQAEEDKKQKNKYQL